VKSIALFTRNNLFKFANVNLAGGALVAKFELKGVNAAFTTPFKNDESIDGGALRKDVQYPVEAGTPTKEKLREIGLT
jgi:hypothetical protein